MIVDRIEDAEIYKRLSPNLAKAIEFLQTANLSSMKIGKFPIDGDNIIANISEYKTKDEEQTKWEAHRQYIDIQYLISGKELIGYAQLKEMVTIEEYNAEKDVLFLNGDGNYVTIQGPIFIILFPQDVHRPCIILGKSELVKKLVIKVKV
jgi:YhcH/YjgK/YiaL family protein